MATLTRHLSIHGRVQGVGFRWSLCTEAQAMGLKGWVRNRRDGSVEAMIHGETGAVEALTHWAHQGPPSAHVERVIVTNRPDQEAELAVLGGFDTRQTA